MEVEPIRRKLVCRGRRLDRWRSSRCPIARSDLTLLEHDRTPPTRMIKQFEQRGARQNWRRVKKSEAKKGRGECYQTDGKEPQENNNTGCRGPFFLQRWKERVPFYSVTYIFDLWVLIMEWFLLSMEEYYYNKHHNRNHCSSTSGSKMPLANAQWTRVLSLRLYYLPNQCSWPSKKGLIRAAARSAKRTLNKGPNPRHPLGRYAVIPIRNCETRLGQQKDRNVSEWERG